MTTSPVSNKFGQVVAPESPFSPLGPGGPGGPCSPLRRVITTLFGGLSCPIAEAMKNPDAAARIVDIIMMLTAFFTMLQSFPESLHSFFALVHFVLDYRLDGPNRASYARQRRYNSQNILTWRHLPKAVAAYYRPCLVQPDA